MQRRHAGLTVLVVFGFGLGTRLAVGEISGRSDERDRRSLYEQFEVFPGATQVDAQGYEIGSDSGGTGEFGLRVTYELPPEAMSAGVIAHYRSRLPAGWSIVDDRTCAALRRQVPPPPTMIGATSIASSTVPDDSVVMLTGSHLTAIAPGASPLDGQRFDGVTFALSRVGDVKYLIADEPDFACGPPETDRFAVEFDAVP